MNDSILPINSSAAEQALEQSCAKATQLPIEIGKLWNPDSCPVALLPWLAWSLSIDEWDSQWSEATQRLQIKNSAAIHSKKGTVGAVKKALSTLGVSVDFLEWFEDPDDIVLASVHSTQPHTFVFIAWANENPYTSQQVFLNPELYDTIQRIVTAHKPVRSHFDFLVGAKLDSQLFVATTTSGWSQVRRICQQTKPVQIPPSFCALTSTLTTSSHNVSVNRHLSRTLPVQVPTGFSHLTAVMGLSRKGFAVSRFYFREN